LFKHKNADMIDRTSVLEGKTAKLQTDLRKNMEAQEKVKNLEEMMLDAENELE